MKALRCSRFRPLDEQAAIVRYLDHADRRISRYIRAKQRLIELLEEEKQAIIHRAVTRGLDPDVRLKPSGVEWLGEVPEHWEVRKTGRSVQTPRKRDLHLQVTSDYGGGIPLGDERGSVTDVFCSITTNSGTDRPPLLFEGVSALQMYPPRWSWSWRMYGATIDGEPFDTEHGRMLLIQACCVLEQILASTASTYY